ncbi:hypothetical protein [Plantactinospora endophytica]|uniref:Tetratricopeptide repeat protein n=1 Tax=Plantactinospora endophytica TaxID=673535 RepID=A0ABQ4DZ02_9ACTN|nr:hypothetical protein [Plantactinospora endophytica]GIG87680.1 hypothetical protein Pen02_26160 [Plantactinospora endophytica]
MRASSLLHKAVLLLRHGDPGRAETVLRAAIASADRDGDAGTRVTARCCLAELLLARDRRSAEAVRLLHACLAVRRDADLDDVVGDDLRRARRLLADLAR